MRQFSEGATDVTKVVSDSAEAKYLQKTTGTSSYEAIEELKAERPATSKGVVLRCRILVYDGAVPTLESSAIPTPV